MKRILLILLSIIAIVVFYLAHTGYAYSPLNKSDFQKIFKGYTECPKKICSKDFLGISSHGELFEIYIYSAKNVLIDKDFPKITDWETKKITNDVLVGKWHNCPLDTLSMNLYKFTLTAHDFDDVKCCNSFNKNIVNAKNYYSYIYFNELEQYFLLYCTDKQELYYIRRKGF